MLQRKRSPTLPLTEFLPPDAPDKPLPIRPCSPPKNLALLSPSSLRQFFQNPNPDFYYMTLPRVNFARPHIMVARTANRLSQFTNSVTNWFDHERLRVKTNSNCQFESKSNSIQFNSGSGSCNSIQVQVHAMLRKGSP